MIPIISLENGSPFKKSTSALAFGYQYYSVRRNRISTSKRVSIDVRRYNESISSNFEYVKMKFGGIDLNCRFQLYTCLVNGVTFIREKLFMRLVPFNFCLIAVKKSIELLFKMMNPFNRLTSLQR